MATENFKPVTLSLDTDKMARAWAERTVATLQQFLDKKLGAAATRELMRSIEYELKRNGGNIDKVITKFAQYGRFYDMRVGRGTPLGTQNNKRRNMKWFSKNYYREVQRFMELYEYEFRQQIPLQIAESFDMTVNGNV